jgi:hypothetical protein
MDKLSTPRNSVEKNAQKYFAKAEQTAETARKLQKKDSALVAANTARLRALRLAKEAVDKEAADHLAAEIAKTKPAKRPARPSTPRKAVRRRIYY